MILLLISAILFSDANSPIVQRILDNYPGIVTGYSDNHIYFHDGSSMIFDDGKKKSAQELLDDPDIQDQFQYEYVKGKLSRNPKTDPGRIRNEDFFKKVYGGSPEAVQKNLTEIIWCPKLVGQKIRVTKTNGVDRKLKAVSDELDIHPEWKEFLKDAGGTFNWRKIKGTSRLSMHSFGMTIDINVKNSDYWQWSCKCTDENAEVKQYHNKIPYGIVEIFERHGFIWGGKWKHFDTMHFEYRPELLDQNNN